MSPPRSVQGAVGWSVGQAGAGRTERLLAAGAVDQHPSAVNGDEIVYQAVVARRLQWDNLVWQVPLLSLTAQAFLFTIALGSGTTMVARCISAGLSRPSPCARMRGAADQPAQWAVLSAPRSLRRRVCIAARSRSSTRAVEQDLPQ
jgi:hypothetical protein